ATTRSAFDTGTDAVVAPICASPVGPFTAVSLPAPAPVPPPPVTPMPARPLPALPGRTSPPPPDDRRRSPPVLLTPAPDAATPLRSCGGMSLRLSRSEERRVGKECK